MIIMWETYLTDEPKIKRLLYNKYSSVFLDYVMSNLNEEELNFIEICFLIKYIL